MTSAPWYRSLSQVSKILLTAVHAKLTPCELAIVAVLLHRPDYRVGCVSDLWNWGGLFDWPDHQAVKVLPFTRQGIEKGLAKLVERGWAERVPYSGRTYTRDRDPAFQLLTLAILVDAPNWIRSQPELSKPTSAKATKVGRRSTANKSSKRPSSRGSKKKANASSKRPRAAKSVKVPAKTQAVVKTAADAAEEVNQIVVTVTRGETYYQCKCEYGPPAFYPLGSHSMPGAARGYALKCWARLLEKDLDWQDVSPTRIDKGVYSYTVNPAKRGGGRG